jgi:hypothetical protein
MNGDVGSGLTFRSPAPRCKQQVRIARKFRGGKSRWRPPWSRWSQRPKAVVVRNGDAFVVAKVAAVTRCLPLRHGADVGMTVADDAIQSNERLIKGSACSRAADWSQAAT